MGDRQPRHKPQHDHSLATLAEMPRTQGTAKTWHPSAGCLSAPSKSSIREKSATDDTGMLLVIQPLGGKKPFSSNGFPYRPSQNTDAFIPQAVFLGGEMLLLHAASWGRERNEMACPLSGRKPKAQPGINLYLIPV